jgi:CRP/FNR family transcriptional regulator, dissimilatory nitrate respiration regulator
VKAEVILSNCRFFSAVTGASRQRLNDMAQVRSFERGTLIFRQGEPCAGMFVVGTGLVRVFKTAPSGKEHVLHLVAPGGTFAEVAAMGAFDYPAFAEAVEDTAAVLLPARALTQALREDHQLCLQLIGSLSMWVRHLLGLVEDITLRDAAGRVARYLLGRSTSADGAVRLPSLKKHLASHLNLTSETLSRTLRRLDEAGLIRTDDDGLAVLDRKALEATAEGLTLM